MRAYLSKEAWKDDWDWVDRFLYLGSEGIQTAPEGKAFVREIRTL